MDQLVLKAQSIPTSLYNETKAELHKLLNAGVIKSNSEWEFPIYVLKKKETELKVGADFRHLNAISIKDCYSLPNLRDVSRMIASCKYFS